MSQLDPTLVTAVLAGLERAVNAALDLDPGAGKALAGLEGKCFALACTAPAVSVYLLPGRDGLSLRGWYDGPITTRVRGAASDFAELASADDPAATLINGSLQLEGDSGALIQLQQIIAGLEPDWEAPLVEVLGDVAGHQLAVFLRASFSTGREASLSLRRQLEEYLHEEGRLAPSRQEVEDFYRDLQALQQRVERLQSRLGRLRRRTQQGKHS